MRLITVIIHVKCVSSTNVLVEQCSLIHVVRKIADTEWALFGACVLITTKTVPLKTIHIILFEEVAPT